MLSLKRPGNRFVKGLVMILMLSLALGTGLWGAEAAKPHAGLGLRVIRPPHHFCVSTMSN